MILFPILFAILIIHTYENVNEFDYDFDDDQLEIINQPKSREEHKLEDERCMTAMPSRIMMNMWRILRDWHDCTFSGHIGTLIHRTFYATGWTRPLKYAYQAWKVISGLRLTLANPHLVICFTLYIYANIFFIYFHKSVDNHFTSAEDRPQPSSGAAWCSRSLLDIVAIVDTQCNTPCGVTRTRNEP